MPTIAISGHTPVNDTGGNSAPSTSAITNPTMNYYNHSNSPQALRPDLLTIMKWIQSLGAGPIPPRSTAGLNLRGFQSTPIQSDSWYFTPGYSKYLI